MMNLSDLEFRVLGIDSLRRAVTLARSDLWDNRDLCHQNGVIIKNTTMNYEFFTYPPAVKNLTVSYGCPEIPLAPVPEGLRSSVNSFTCDDGRNNVYYFANDVVLFHLGPNLTACSGTFQVPIFMNALDQSGNNGSGINEVQEVLRKGFEVAFIYNSGNCDACETSGGRCAVGSNKGLLCLCPDKSSGLFYCGHGMYVCI